MVQVEDKVCSLAGGKGIAVNARTGCSCEFGGNSVGELHAVVARSGGFILVGETYGRIQRIVGDAYFTGKRTYKNISEVGAAGAAEVCVREAVEGAVAVVVARAGVSVIGTGIRAELHSTMRGRGAGIGMTVETGAYHGVGKVYRSIRSPVGTRCQK